MRSDRHERRRRSRKRCVVIPYVVLDSYAWRDLSRAAVRLSLLAAREVAQNSAWQAELTECGFIRVVGAEQFKTRQALLVAGAYRGR